MRTKLVLGAALFALLLGASGKIEIDANIQTAGVGAAGGVVYSQLEEPIRISLR